MFAFNAPVFPVDTHILRIARRLGWLGPKVPLAKAHEHLTDAIAPSARASLHVQLIRLGRAICKARTPRCAWCPLLDLCPTGQAGSAPGGEVRDPR
jgi:endonuclease-3